MLKFLTALAVLVMLCLFAVAAGAWSFDPLLSVGAFLVAMVLAIALGLQLRIDTRMWALPLACLIPLALAGCGTPGKLPIPPDQLASLINTAAPAIKVVAQQDVQAGFIDQPTADAIGAYADAAQVAAAAFQAGSLACLGADRPTCLLAALTQAELAGEQLMVNPAVTKLIGAAAGPRVAAALKAAHTAILAAQDAKAAASATDQQQKLIQANAALLQLNFAVLQGIQAAR